MIFRSFRIFPRIPRSPVAMEESRSKRISMFWFSRKRLILTSLITLALAVGGWIYARRPKPVVMASYVPESALGYLEVNDWPRMVDNLTSTKAWRELAPAYGIPEELKYIGKAGLLNWGDWVARITGRGETAMLARSQFAVLVTA